ncbi:TonB-dependent receptor [Pseudoduganella violaceinigra]|uniref:TonB-dependent receptor n=1 Tax=Pseudoduganella violaceinigra TaxID=246602 RepID=UPI00041C366F|nr:TonB-dependent receptor [Pseudoduganella violaceinigra]
MDAQIYLNPLCLAAMLMQAVGGVAYAAGDPGTDTIPVVEVLGAGQSRQTQSISHADIVKAVPGGSPLKALEKLPGVSFQSSDPFGAYEWSTRISIRGFNQNQLGFTLDGVPLGDMSYGNNNGLHISRAISSENIGRVAVSQGAGALGTASTSNLGGTVQFFTVSPADSRGLDFAQTLGSDNTSRTFVRIDSGQMSGNTKFFISGTRQRADKWKGWGGQDQDQFNSRIEYRFDGGQMSAFYNYSGRKETDYQDLSLEMLGRLGYNWDNYAPDWQRAVNAANKVFNGAVNNLDDAYYLGRGLRKDHLGGVSLEWNPAPNVELKTTIYRHENQGQGHWYTPYTASSPVMPISIRTTEYAIGRNGLVSDLSWNFANNQLTAGLWAERSHHALARNFYAVTGPEDTNHFLSGPMSTGFKQDFETVTRQFYVQDSLSAMEGKLKINGGFKSPRVRIDAISLAGSRAGGVIQASKTFLPQGGLTYAVTPDDEVFASAASNMRAYQPGVSGPFSQTQAAVNRSQPTLKPETSTNLDLGYRFKRPGIQGSLALYRVRFDDRLLSVATCVGIAGCPSTFVNVGKVRTRGLEAIAVWKISRDLSWFNTATLNDSRYQSDYMDNGKLLAVNGKYVVDTPRKMLSSELAFENAAWFATLGAKYTGKRFYTYVNDGAVPSYWLGNLSAGYKLPAGGMFKELVLQLNVSNLFDKRYFATIGSNGFVASDAMGTFATLQGGAPRQFFISIRGKL